MKSAFVALITVLVSLSCFSQNSSKAWQRDVRPMYDTTGTCSYFIEEDFDNNFMIAGGSMDGDIIISLMDSLGSVHWSKRFGGSAIESDQVTAIRVVNGLIYVTGYLNNHLTDRDIFVKCFSGNGAELFSFISDGGYSKRDQGNSVEVNAVGLVFVGGIITDSNLDTRGILICLNPIGVVLWQDILTGSATGDNTCNDLWVDSGSVIVAGSLYNTVTGSDGIVRSYDTAGNINWTYTYDYLNNQGRYDIIKENGGYLYGCGLGNGMILSKIDFQGNLIWNNNVGFDISFGLNFQSDGDVVTTGTDNVSGNTEIRVACYNAMGTLNWNYTYVPSPYNGADYPSSVKIDATDQVYVTGRQAVSTINSDQLLLKLGANGGLQWARRRSGSSTGVALEFCGGMRIYASRIVSLGVVINTGNNEDGTYSAYNYNGTSLSFIQFDYPGKTVARDPLIFKNDQNNSIIIGCSSFANSVLLEEYSSAGTLLRRDSILCSFYWMPWLRAMCQDSLGNIYLGINFINSSGNYDFQLTKLNPAWTVAWSVYYSSPNTVNDYVNDIAVDDSGNVFVAGDGSISGSSDAMVLKYSSSGVLLTSHYFGGTANNIDNASKILITPSNSIYLSGLQINSGTGTDVFLARLNNLGDTIWNRTFTGLMPNGNDYISSLLSFANDDIAVVGYTYLTASDRNIFVNRYTSGGSLNWSWQLTDPVLQGAEEAKSAIMVNDTVYIAGTCQDTSLTDALAVSVDGAGNQLWWRSYDGVISRNDVAYDIEYNDFTRTVWLTGYSDKVFSSLQNAIVLGYTSNGLPIDTIIESNIMDSGIGLEIVLDDTSSSIYFSIEEQNSSSGLVKYCADGSSGSTSASALICHGDSIQLSAPVAGSYSWSPNLWITDTTIQSPVVFPAVSTVYTLVTQNIQGCSSSHMYSVTLTPDSMLSVLTPSLNLCSGDTVQLAVTGLLTYNWTPSVDLSAYNVAAPLFYGDSAQLYYVTGTDYFGCLSYTGLVNVVVAPLPSVALNLLIPDTLCLLPGGLVLNGGAPAGGTYSGSGVVSNVFHPDQADTGYVVITYQFIDSISGCSDLAHDSVYIVICTALSESENSWITVYPTVASDRIFISSGNASFSELKLYSITGEVLKDMKFAPEHSMEVDISDLASGSYIIVISGPEVREVKKIFKNN